MIRIYVSAYSYTDDLHGGWVTVTDVETMEAEIRDILLTSPDPSSEEWEASDFEGFGELDIPAHPDLEMVVELGTCIQKWGEPYLAHLVHLGGIAEMDAAKRDFENVDKGFKV